MSADPGRCQIQHCRATVFYDQIDEHDVLLCTAHGMYALRLLAFSEDKPQPLNGQIADAIRTIEAEERNVGP